MEWRVLKPLIPDNKGKKGRPSRDHRLVLEAILWVLRTGAPWRDIPQEFGSWNTAYTRFRRWIIKGNALFLADVPVHVKRSMIKSYIKIKVSC
jgi:transposase